MKSHRLRSTLAPQWGHRSNENAAMVASAPGSTGQTEASPWLFLAFMIPTPTTTNARQTTHDRCALVRIVIACA